MSEPAPERTNVDSYKSDEINPDAPRQPFLYEMQEGVRFSWCTCGFSSKEPLCDGAHRECTTGLRSFKYTPEKTGKVMLCGCKRTKNPPFCDGSHSKL